MWDDDRRYHVRDLTTLKRDVERLLEEIPNRIADLRDDDAEGTRESRARLVEARDALSAAFTAVDLARFQLPEGKQRPPLRSV